MSECRSVVLPLLTMLLTGAPAIPAQNVLLSFPFPYLNPTYGWSNCAVGDSTGDGAPDFALGYPEANRVDVRSGFDGSIVAILTVPGSAPYEFGFSIDSGDINGDQVLDLIVGTPVCSSFSPENVGVYLGPSWTLSMTVFHPAGAAGTCLTRFGQAVRFAGDVNADGWGDFLVFG